MVHAKSLLRKIFQCKDLLHEIMVLLEAEDLCHIAQTSHKCRAAANDDRGGVRVEKCSKLPELPNRNPPGGGRGGWGGRSGEGWG